MDGLIGTYRGANIYMITLTDFLAMDADKRHTKDNWWYISDDNNLIFGGQIIGKLNNRVVDFWKERIDADRAYAAKARKMMKREAMLKPKPKATILSERPTIEALVKEGEGKLEEVLASSKASLLENLGTGEEKLAEVVDEGTQIVEMIKKAKRTVAEE